MNLIRMLRVSDTFTAGEIPMGRYHIVGLKALPRFGRRVPALREAALPGGGPCPVGDGEQLPLEADGTAPSVRDGGSGPGSGEAAQGRSSGRLARWVRWLDGRLQTRRNPFGGGGPRLAKTTVPSQGCLRLDGVRVVRNDLSDADFEVLPARRAVARKPSGAEATAVSCDFQAPPPSGSAPAELQAGNL